MNERMNNMSGLTSAYKYFQFIKIIGAWISGIGLFGMMFMIVYDVFLRNVMGNSINGAFEIVQNYFMPLAVFPALAYIYASGVLPKMDLLIEKFNIPTKRIVIFGILLIEIFILVLMTLYTLEYAMTGLEKKMAFPAAGTMYPVYPLFFTIPIAFGLIVVENVFIFISNIFKKEPSFIFETEENKELNNKVQVTF